MFRVTPFSVSNSALANYQNLMSNLGRLQDQASSGLKYRRPSDHPIETAQINVLKHSVFELSLQQSKIQGSNRQLNFGVTNLLEANTIVTRARQIALEAPQSLGDTDRRALASELDSMLEQLASIANTRDHNQFLFSGSSVTTQPVSITQHTGLPIPTVRYAGSDQRIASSVSESIAIDIQYSGREIFFHQQRGETLYFGNTGARAGTAVDSAIGRATLTVRHTNTSFAAGSGVQAGADSIQGDTIIGALGTHTLTIRDTSGDGSSGTVSLNAGPEIAWSQTDTNLLVQGISGQQVYLDMSNIAAGFDGQVDIQSDGVLSIDGGATETAITFAQNQVINNSLDHTITHVDTRAVNLTGTEQLEYSGSADIFSTLLELKDDLLNSRGLDDNTLNKSFERRLGDLQRHSDRILEYVGLQSASLQDLEHLEKHNGNLSLELQSRLSELESVDLAGVVVDLQNHQTLIQFNFASISLLQGTSILQFLG